MQLTFNVVSKFLDNQKNSDQSPLKSMTWEQNNIRWKYQWKIYGI